MDWTPELGDLDLSSVRGLDVLRQATRGISSSSSLDGMLKSIAVLTSSIKFSANHLFHLVHGERHCESKASFPRSQPYVPGQGLNPDSSFQT